MIAHTSDGIPAFTSPYVKADGLWVITTYFNPCRYKSRRRNFDVFANTMRQSGIPLIVVECAFGDDNFELPNSLDVIKVRASSLLWQKERLLNLAVSWCPPEAKYIAWIDCDIIFKNSNWAVDTAALLEEKYMIVQLFETCTRIAPASANFHQTHVPSYGAIAPHDHSLITCGHFEHHGHTGYGWAMRREVFDTVGLYEYAVCGTGDHFIAHAAFGLYGPCIDMAMKGNARGRRHLLKWSEKFHKIVDGRLSATPGDILHLPHGSLVNRKYMERSHIINELGFDPYQDVTAPPGRPLEWNPAMVNPKLKEYFHEYFLGRREDD